MDSLKQHDVYKVVNISSVPKGEKIIGSRFVFSRRAIQGQNRRARIMSGRNLPLYCTVELCEATPIGLVDEPKVSLYGRETDRDLRSACREATRDFYCERSELLICQVHQFELGCIKKCAH